MKIALVADWLPAFGGAEHVVYEFTKLWPDAPVFTSIVNRKKIGPLSSSDIRTGKLQKMYTLIKNHHVLLPFMPKTFERIDLRGFDVILSSSHAVAKGVIPPSNAVHVCYCHTPMRYAWEMEKEYLRDFKIPSFLQKRVRLELQKLRRWDLSTAKRVDVFIANSSTTQERIKRIYNRESVIINPPVGIELFEEQLTTINNRKKYYLAVGRFVPYKRFDLLIETANKMNLPLKIVGTGEDEKRLRALAGNTVEFLGYTSDRELRTLYSEARCVLFPPMEDAGVVPLEAQASGTPVLAFNKGGALDGIADGVTGLFFEEQSVDSLKRSIERFETMSFDPHIIRNHAEKFHEERFREKIQNTVKEAVANFKRPYTALRL